MTNPGTVDFYDEATGNDSGEISLDTNGCATWTPSSPLGAGDHYVVATYTNDSGTFVGGTVAEFDQTVNPATTFVATSTSPTYVNGSVELDATVSVVTGQGTPTGSVEFYDGSTDVGAGTAGSNGQWSLTTSAVPPGNQVIAAVYSGDDNFTGSQSGGTSVNVVGDGLSLGNSLSLRWGTISEGNAATLSGTVSGLDGVAFSVAVDWGDGQTSAGDSGDTLLVSVNWDGDWPCRDRTQDHLRRRTGGRASPAAAGGAADRHDQRLLRPFASRTCGCTTSGAPAGRLPGRRAQ